MATQKEMREFRENFIAQIENVKFEDFVFVGATVDGPAFENENGDVVVVKPIAKKEGFDVNDAIQEQAERIEARQAREMERAKKAAERAAKAAEKAKEAAEAAE